MKGNVCSNGNFFPANASYICDLLIPSQTSDNLKLEGLYRVLEIAVKFAEQFSSFKFTCGNESLV